MVDYMSEITYYKARILIDLYSLEKVIVRFGVTYTVKNLISFNRL